MLLSFPMQCVDTYSTLSIHWHMFGVNSVDTVAQFVRHYYEHYFDLWKGGEANCFITLYCSGFASFIMSSLERFQSFAFLTFSYWSMRSLTILTGKVQQFSTIHSVQYSNGCLAASDLFHMFTQPIKFYKFHCHVLRV